MISKILKRQLFSNKIYSFAAKAEATKVKVGKISQVIGAVVDV